MGKKVTSEILRKYCNFDETEDGDSTLLCQVKWNGREPKGYDIRKYNKETDSVYKGITISYEGITKLVEGIIENGLCDIDEVESFIKNFKNKVFDKNDFDKLFDKVKNEEEKYKRDKYGLLRDNDGHVIIPKRLKY